MPGVLLSDSTTILSTHHRSARKNSFSAHSDHHPHFSHPCLRHSPLSSLPILPTQKSPPPSHASLSPSTLGEMSDKPTLPGIASLLALAGQHRSAPSSSLPTSHSHSSRSPQSSDPIAHALPFSIDPPPLPNTPAVVNYPSSSTSRHPTTYSYHQAPPPPSSSVVIVNAEERLPTYSNPAPPQLQHILSSTCPPSSKHLSCSSYSIPAPPSLHKICNESPHPYGNDTSSPVSDRGVNPSRQYDAGTSSHDIFNHSSSRSNDALRRRHSDRISASLTKSIHHTSSRHNTPSPSQQSCATHPSLHLPQTQSFASTTIDEQDERQVRRRSNASVSSSSSVSGSASISSDFGASLHIASQTYNYRGGAHVASSSASVNSMLSTGKDRTRPPFLTSERPCTNDEVVRNHGWNNSCPLPEDPSSYDFNSRWDPHEGSSHCHNPHKEKANQIFDPRSQMSLSPEIAPSSRLSGPTMSNTASCPQNHRYQCLEVGCGKTFSRPSSLKIHSYSHTGQKPFKCMRCDRAFSVQSNLKRHQKVHEKRSTAVYSRGLSANGNVASPMMAYEGGSERLIEEQSGEEDGGHDYMEE